MLVLRRVHRSLRCDLERYLQKCKNVGTTSPRPSDKPTVKPSSSNDLVSWKKKNLHNLPCENIRVSVQQPTEASHSLTEAKNLKKPTHCSDTDHPNSNVVDEIGHVHVVSVGGYGYALTANDSQLPETLLIPSQQRLTSDNNLSCRDNQPHLNSDIVAMMTTTTIPMPYTLSASLVPRRTANISHKTNIGACFVSMPLDSNCRVLC